MTTWLRWFLTLVVDNADSFDLSSPCLFSESRPLLRSLHGPILPVFALLTPESHRPPSVSLFHGFSDFVFWSVKLGWGEGIALYQGLGRPPESLPSTIFTVRWIWAFSFNHIGFCYLYCPLSPVHVWGIVGVRPWRYICITRASRWLILSFSKPSHYMQLSWNTLSLRVTLPAFSSPIRCGKLFFCRFGSHVLTYDSSPGPCPYMRLSSYFSPLVFCSRRLCFQQLNILAVSCPQCWLLLMGSSIQSSDFYFMSFCSAVAVLLFHLWFAASVSGLQFRTWLCRRQPCAMSVRHFFREAVITCSSLFFLSIWRCSLSLRCFEWFRLWFVYLDRSSSIFGIHCGRRGRMSCVAPAVPSKLGWVPRHC